MALVDPAQKSQADVNRGIEAEIVLFRDKNTITRPLTNTFYLLRLSISNRLYCCPNSQYGCPNKPFNCNGIAYDKK